MLCIFITQNSVVQANQKDCWLLTKSPFYYVYVPLFFTLNFFILLFQARRVRKSRKDRLCPWQTFWAHKVDPTRQESTFQRTQAAGLTRYVKIHIRANLAFRPFCSWWHVSDCLFVVAGWRLRWWAQARRSWWRGCPNRYRPANR